MAASKPIFNFIPLDSIVPERGTVIKVKMFILLLKSNGLESLLV